jgi:hypothetical protein
LIPRVIAAQNAPDEAAQKDIAARAAHIGRHAGVVEAADSFGPARLHDHDALRAIWRAFGKRVVGFSVAADAPRVLISFTRATAMSVVPGVTFLRSFATITSERSAGIDNRPGNGNAASAGLITPQLIQDRPLLRPGNLLEIRSGMVVTQYAGAGKDNQYFVRGSNLGGPTSPRGLRVCR